MRRRRQRLWAVVMWVALASCTKTPSAAPPALDAGVRFAPVPATAVPAAEEAAPFELTEALLDRFIQYQRRMISLYRDVLDAGQPGSADEQRLQRLSAAERQARLEAELELDEVRELERVVGDVLARRTVTQTLDPGAALKQLESLRDKLAPEHQAMLEPTLKELTTEHQAAQSMSAEKARFGEENVELVLRRQDELSELWQARLDVFLEKQR